MSPAELIIYGLKVLPYVANRLVGCLYKSAMGKCGRRVYLVPLKSDYKGLRNFFIGNNVSIPRGATLYSTDARLIIKDNVIFGPNPTIITGNHRIDVIGLPIISSYEKLPENDQDVVIEEDVWAGANVVILKGVTIGRGSVIAAGAVVNKSVPPYSIVGGVPACILKSRFSVDEVLKHEERLYSRDERYTREILESYKNM